MFFDLNFALIAVLIASIQIADSYLRYLAFDKKISGTRSRQLWSRLFFCAAGVSVLYFEIFLNFGMSAICYKLILMFGWIPFFLISVKTVPLTKLQHFFIFGMSAIWNLFVHSVAAMFDTIFLAAEPHTVIYIFHAIIYLTIFLLLLPIERKCFINLLPGVNFFDNQPYGKYLVALPFVIIFGVLILWTDNNLFHSWQERFSRLYLPFTFFLFYRYVLNADKQIFENRKTERYNRHLKAQLSALEQYNLLVQKSRQQTAVLRHDLRHNYRLIYMMLRDGKVDEVMERIKILENLPDLTAEKFFCNSPLINAALSIYFQLAEKNGITLKQKINLPEKLNVDEGDVAILISNLLENAVKAAGFQPPDRREIGIRFEHAGNQCVLEITNLFDGEIVFENGLPKTSEDGHGIGMLSLKNFVEKYGAQTDFSHESGEVKVIIYFENIRNFRE